MPEALRCRTCGTGCAGADASSERAATAAGGREKFLIAARDKAVERLAARVLGEAGLRRLPCLNGRAKNARDVQPCAECLVIVSGVNARQGANAEADVDLALNKRAYAVPRGTLCTVDFPRKRDALWRAARRPSSSLRILGISSSEPRRRRDRPLGISSS